MFDNPTVNLTIATVLFAVFLIAFVLVMIRRRHVQPNNNSLLNSAQILSVVGVLALVGGLLLSLFTLFFPGFRVLILTFFITVETVGFVFWFYDPVLAIVSMFWRKRKFRNQPFPQTPGKMNRFAVLGCAHNEEAVIEHLIESIHKADYPQDMYDIYIICDNCTDNTAKVARKAGALAMERHDPKNRGKSFGLAWMFNILNDERRLGNRYDAYVVLDADNLISPNFFKSANRELNKGHEILQAYLDCKNPDDSWISRSYSVNYWITNFIYQRPHSRLGLSAQLGGTGMIFRPSVLDNIGWDTKTLTEDLLLTTRYVLETNRPCVWLHDAHIYDEKPLKLQNSIRQRTRWMQGHMDTMVRYFFKIGGLGIKNLSLKQIDVAFYLVRPLLSMIMLVTFAIRWLFHYITPGGLVDQTTFILNVPLAISLLVGYILMQAIALIKEKRAVYILWLPVQLIFSLTVYPAILRGFIKRKEKYWVSTVHTRAISIDQALTTDLTEPAES